jgi:hypothetical protein
MKRDKTIQDKLKEIAPFLASLGKTNNLKVPEGYFEQNTPNLIEAIQIEEKVKELRKLTGKMAKQAVPAGYFETFPSKIIARVNSGKEIKVISFQKRSGWKQWLQVAAAVAAIMIMAVPFLKNNTMKQDTIETALHKVSDVELNSYVSEHSVSFNEDEIATHVSDIKLEQAANKITAEHVTNDDESLIDVTQIDVNDIQNL